MTRVHTDLSRVPISVAPSPATSGTSLGVTDANAAYLPDVYPYWAVLVPTGAAPTRANSEIVKVTAGSSSGGTTTLTIVRAQGTPVTTAKTVTTSFDIYDANAVESISFDGWIPLNTCTYEGADAPSYTISFASDMTAILSVGMRIKLTDSTVKYFIITAVGAFSGGKTIITVYGGTDYTLSGGAITLPYYSYQKAPFGFPLSPVKWTAEVADSTQRSQGTPTNGTWYNLGSVTLSIPIGLWRVEYFVDLQINDSTSGAYDVFSTLSTANNSESDTQFTNGAPLAVVTAAGWASTRAKFLVLAAKTSYYLNTKVGTANVDTVYNRNDFGQAIIRAICAYL